MKGQCEFMRRPRVFITILISFSMLLSIALAISYTNPETAPFEKVRDSAYLPHSLIRIYNDTNFSDTALQEGWLGDGSPGNPYIIANYEINASGALVGIYISNTTVHFKIQDCRVHDAANLDIFLFNVSNGVLTRDEFVLTKNNGYGIYLKFSKSCLLETVNSSSNSAHNLYMYYSNDTIIRNSTFSHSGSGDGILLSNSNNNRIENNDCSWNNQYGLRLYDTCNSNIVSNNSALNNQHAITLDSDCDHNIVYNNTCAFNTDGILLINSDFNLIQDNSCHDNTYGIDLDFSQHNEIIDNMLDTNIQCSMLIGYDSDDNIIVNNSCSAFMHAIYLYYCTGNELLNNTCSGSSNGIILWNAINNTIRSNTLEQNNQGIAVYSSSDGNVFSYNMISNSTSYGIYLESGQNNDIWNNTFYHNNGTGDAYDPLHIQAYDSGINNTWNHSGSPHGYGNWWSDWQTPDNNADGMVDYEYNISGSAGAKDWYPLTTQPVIPEPPIFVLVIIMTAGFLFVRRKMSR